MRVNEGEGWAHKRAVGIEHERESRKENVTEERDLSPKTIMAARSTQKLRKRAEKRGSVAGLKGTRQAAKFETPGRPTKSPNACMRLKEKRKVRGNGSTEEKTSGIKVEISTEGYTALRTRQQKETEE